MVLLTVQSIHRALRIYTTAPVCITAPDGGILRLTQTSALQATATTSASAKPAANSQAAY